MFKWLFRACFSMAVVAGLLAGYTLLIPQDPTPAFSIEPLVVEAFDRPVGEHELVFRVANASSRAITLVGMDIG